MRALHRCLSAELAHDLAVTALRLRAAAPTRRPASRWPIRCAGLDLAHPIGLAAGFDKNAQAIKGAFHLGFAAVEVGAITPRPQPGNPKPRVFRLSEDRAVINRMGFNNRGLEAAAARLERLADRPGPIGANIGKNKDGDPIGDYVTCVRRLSGLVDYFSVNVSSPNTPGLRELQSLDELERLADAIAQARDERAGPRPPIFLKLAPDLEDRALERIAEFTLSAPIDGLILTNTTIERPTELASAHAQEAGGLSGRPLAGRATRAIRIARKVINGRKPLIGVGGIESAAGVIERIEAGADWVQLYTALVYEGPALVGRILEDLDRALRERGAARIDELVGARA